MIIFTSVIIIMTLIMIVVITILVNLIVGSTSFESWLREEGSSDVRPPGASCGSC